MRALGPIAVAGALTIGAAGCSPEACPVDVTECPAGCNPMRGSPYDPVEQCLLPAEILGCRASEPPVTGDIACVRRLSDGTLFWLPSGSYAGRLLANSDDWLACTGEEWNMLTGVSPCAAPPP
jgi:hypothetical protein